MESRSNGRKNETGSLGHPWVLTRTQVHKCGLTLLERFQIFTVYTSTRRATRARCQLSLSLCHPKAKTTIFFHLVPLPSSHSFAAKNELKFEMKQKCYSLICQLPYKSSGKIKIPLLLAKVSIYSGVLLTFILLNIHSFILYIKYKATLDHVDIFPQIKNGTNLEFSNQWNLVTNLS